MWKDHTGVYEAFRRSYRATAVPLVSTSPKKAVFENEVYTRLAPDEDGAFELEAISPRPVTCSRVPSPPSPTVRHWLTAYAELRGFLDNLANAIERLSSEYQRHTIDWSRRWQDEREGGGMTGEDSLTIHIFKQISGMFAVAPVKIDQLTSLQVEMTGVDWRQIKENVRHALYGKLAHLADRLRQAQAMAATHQQSLLRSAKNIMKKLSSSGSPLASTKMASSDHEVGFDLLKDGETLTTEEGPLDRETSQERSREIDRLMVSMAQVIELLKSMHTLVSHQGSLLDRIDVNLERSQHYVRKANVKLTAVRGDQVSQTRKMILLFLFLLIFILFIAVLSPRR